MNTISTRLQKAVLYVPFMNYFNFFIWGYNCLCMRVSIRQSSKVLDKVFLRVLIPTLLELVCACFKPELEDILRMINVYLSPILAGKVLIAYQENELLID